MDRQAVLSTIKRILSEDLFVGVPTEEIKDSDAIGGDLGLDSVGFVELGTIVAEVFKIEVTDRDVASGEFATVSTLCDFILRRQGEGQEATAPVA